MSDALLNLARIRNRKTGRFSSYDRTGRNSDGWTIKPGESRVLADIRGPGVITHIWLTQTNNYRQCLLKFTWDDAPHASVIAPVGDFFGLGHGIVNSYQSALFTASTWAKNQFDRPCALNCYAPMPFARRAVVELVNETGEDHSMYYYVDYETLDPRECEGLGYFHAEFRRANPFGGWGPEITVNSASANAVNTERQAWDNNYVILDTKGRGQYIGCNLSVTNIQGTWWGEGDDMIWVDGYKWPPDIHGTGSEDYLNQAWGMQPNAFMRNGTSVDENQTGSLGAAKGVAVDAGGYQTSYVHHLENPVRFQREIKVTIEHGHANHLGNEMSSVAYWYAEKPAAAIAPPPLAQRLPVLKINGRWTHDPARQCPGKPVALTDEMRRLKEQWKAEQQVIQSGRLSDWHSEFVPTWSISRLMPPQELAAVAPVSLGDDLGWKVVEPAANAKGKNKSFVSVHSIHGDADGVAYLANRFAVPKAGQWTIHLGHDGGAKLLVDGREVLCEPKRLNPAKWTRSQATVDLSKGSHEIVVALDTHEGMGWGIFFSFELPQDQRKAGAKPAFPKRVE